MNKNYIKLIALLIITSLLLIGCETTSETTNLEDYVNLQSVEEVIAKMDNKETFNFVIGNEGCPACLYYKEELQKFHKSEGYKFDYINIDGNTNRELLQELVKDKVGSKEEYLATPTTYFIVDGKLEVEEIGAIEADKIKEYSQYYK